MSTIVARSRVSGKLWENRRIGVGVNFRAHKQDVVEREASQNYENQIKRGKPDVLDASDSEHLGLSIATSLTKNDRPLTRKGLRGLSGIGKVRIPNAGLRLQKVYGRKNISFTTLTLPKLPDELWDVVSASDWTLLEDKVRKLFMYYLKKQSIEDFCYVAEIQEDRFKETGKPYIHYHILHPCRHKRYRCKQTNKMLWIISADDLRKKWSKLVWNWIRELGNKYNVCLGNKFAESKPVFNASIDMQVIRKDASRYMAKYASKGADCIDAMIEAGYENCIPYHWYYISKSLIAKVLQAVKIVKEYVATVLLEEAKKVCGTNTASVLFEWVKLITRIKENGDELICGFAGSMSRDGVKYVHSLVNLQS